MIIWHKKKQFELTVKQIQAAKPKEKDYKLSDRDGLFLLITKRNKIWKLRFFWLKKEQTMTLGFFPRMSLLEARAATMEARAKLDNGINPLTEKEAKKAELEEEQARIEEVDHIIATVGYHPDSFATMALEWLADYTQDFAP